MVTFWMGPISDERSGLVDCMRQQQEAFEAVAHGLTDEQARRAPSASSLSVGGLIRHVTIAQRTWTDRVLAAPDFPAPLSSTDWESGFAMREGETLAALLEEFSEQSGATREAVRAADLDARVPIPKDAPWFPKDRDFWSVRWVALHLIEELARHAGHADIIRESVDGATMYELMAAAMGLPETDWLKPWRPKAS